MTDPAFVLLGVPIELEGANGSEGGEGRVEDNKVDIVAQVDPGADENGEVWEDQRGVEIIEGFGRLWTLAVSCCRASGESERKIDLPRGRSR